MGNFGRALRIALGHRLNVVACIFTSLTIACLWAGNLVAVWPIVDAVMQQKSVPQWIDGMIDEGQEKIARLEARQEAIAAALPEAEGDQRVALVQEQSQIEHDLTAYQLELKTHRRLRPYAERWLPDTPFETLCYVCAFVICGTVLKNLFRVANSLLVNRVGCLTTLALRNQYYHKVLRLEMAAFNERGRGDLMSRCTSDLGAVGAGVKCLVGQAIREPLKMIACFCGAAYVSWRLLLLTIIITPIAVLAIRWLSKAIKRANRRAMEENATIYENLTETISGIGIIKAFTMEPAERARFSQSAHTFYGRQMKVAWYGALVSPVTEIIGIFMVVMAAVMGGYLVLNQQTSLLGLQISDTPLTHGQMSMFFAMLAGMSDPARRLSGVLNEIQRASASADRVYEVLDRTPKITSPTPATPLPVRVKSFEFKDLSFAYDPGHPVLQDVNLSFRAGETIAIVGPNGCGKSTLLNLLPRFFDPSAGAVTFDGIDIRNARLRDLRKRIGIVSQTALLFNDTVAANIAYGSPRATLEQVEQAARKAYAHGFVTEKLAEGYQTTVGPGGNRLSGGQRQRLALARAILRDPEILILDEATSQIDVESEQLIHKVLETFTRDRTTFLITHRPSTLSLADRVVVMDHGHIEDIGTTDELLARCDLFRRLCHVTYRESA